MRKETMKKVMALGMSAAMLAGYATTASAAENTSSAAAQEQTWDHLDKVTLYPSDTSTASGLVTGYKADILAKYGLEMEIWAYSDEKTNAILTSGDLPDVMYVNYDNMKTMIEGGMILDLEDYMDQMPNIANDELIQTALNYTREYKSADTGHVYGIPTQIGTTEEQTDPWRNQIKVNWKAYYAAGCPEINSFDDLIPVMKKMLEVMPESEVDGTKCWGTILNSGSDDTYWGNIQLWYKFWGYEPTNVQYLIENDMINEEYHSILEDDRDSMYYKGLKWYNECMREGVMDPDSINNERQVQKAKVETSLACMIPSGTCAGWSGYKGVYVPGTTQLQETWAQPYGTDMYLVVSAKSENPEAAVRVLNMLASTDTYFDIWCGPEGDLWEYGEDGLVYPTEYGLQTAIDGSEVVFASTGEKRVQWLDNGIVSRAYSTSYIGPDGPRHARGLSDWPEVKAVTDQNEENTQWRETFGAQTVTELLKSHDAYKLKSALSNVESFCPEPDDVMKLTLSAIKDVVVEASWKMVYAADDDEFEQLWDQMIADCKDLGAEDIVEWRMEELEKAAEIKNSLEAK